VNGQNYWSINVDIHGKSATIYAGKKTDDINGFTHELLHIIQEINGQFSHLTLPTLIAMSKSPFRFIMTGELVGHINNVILHDRMINDYISQGFPKNKFVYDYYYKPKKTSTKKKDYVLTNLQKIDRNRLMQFLNLFFSYRFHPNESLKQYYFSEIINKYNLTNSQLITDLELLSSNWENQTIVKNNHFFYNLLTCLDNWKLINNYS